MKIEVTPENILAFQRVHKLFKLSTDGFGSSYWWSDNVQTALSDGFFGLSAGIVKSIMDLDGRYGMNKNGVRRFESYARLDSYILPTSSSWVDEFCRSGTALVKLEELFTKTPTHKLQVFIEAIKAFRLLRRETESTEFDKKHSEDVSMTVEVLEEQRETLAIVKKEIVKLEIEVNRSEIKGYSSKCSQSQGTYPDFKIFSDYNIEDRFLQFQQIATPQNIETITKVIENATAKFKGRADYKKTKVIAFLNQYCSAAILRHL